MSFNPIDEQFELPDRPMLTDLDVVAQIVFASGRLPDDFLIGRLEDALRQCYAALAGQPVGNFETRREIRDVGSGSIIVWFRFNLESARNPSVTTPDLTVLNRGTLTILRWLAVPSPQLADLSRAIQVLVHDTFPGEAPMPSQRHIISAVASLQELQESIPDAGMIKFALHCGAAELPLGKAGINLDVLVGKAVMNGVGEMILIVDRPDYARKGSWEFRHGQENIRAVCEPDPIVEGFHRRSVDIRPGDALRCRVRVERSYSADNMLLSEQFAVEEILAILSDDFTSPPSALEVTQEPRFSIAGDQSDDRIIERIEGDFGTLTLREIPVN